MNRQQRRQQEKQKKRNGRSKVSTPARPVAAQRRLEQGVELYTANRFSEAEAVFREITKAYPDIAHAFFLLGATLEAQGRIKDCISEYESATIKAPQNDTYLNSLALVCEQQGDDERAIELFQKAIQVNPESLLGHYNLGNSYYRKNQNDKAIGCFQKAVSINPKQLEPHINLSTALQKVNRLVEAVDSFRNVLALDPTNASAHHNLGNCHRYLDRPEDAITHHRQAIELKPGNAKYRYGLAFPLLACGQIQEGLDAYEYRFQGTVEPRRFSKPLWDGRSDLTDQTILIWGEQGVGDVVIWASGVTEIISRAKHCIIECHPKILGLLQRSFPDAEVREETPEPDEDRADIDTHLPIASLFQRLRPDLSAGLSPDAYIKADPERVEFWRTRLAELGPGLKVGISWASPHATAKRAPNYTDLTEWASILQTPGVDFINLQCMDYKNDLNHIRDTLGITVHNFEDLDLFHDIEGISGLVTALDLVISVATGVAPISAALGTKVWQLTWRQSPWSNFLLSPRGPDVTYFYRNTMEPWDGAIKEVAGHLAELTTD
jgi:tetratricopeptide (TPR) repeat protein